MENKKNITINRERRDMVFTVSKEYLSRNPKTSIQIMEENGYHTAAYGHPYNYKDNGDGTISFKCSNSSD